MEKLKNLLISRRSQPSTWAGLVVFIAAWVGYSDLSLENAQSIVGLIIQVVGLVEMIRDEKKA